jgi:Mce-associated membrane protein
VIGHDVEDDVIDIDEDSTEDSTEVGADRPAPPEDGRRAVELGVLLVAVLLLALAVVTWSRASGHDDEAVARADLRDTVLITARSHIETMNTLDHREITDGLAAWETVSTGTLKDQIVATSEETKLLMADQGKISTGKVVDAAVVDLTVDTATVIASVEVTVRDGLDLAAEPVVKRNRFAADLVRIGDDWLLEALDQVAVDLS